MIATKPTAGRARACAARVVAAATRRAPDRERPARRNPPEAGSLVRPPGAEDNGSERLGGPGDILKDSGTRGRAPSRISQMSPRDPPGVLGGAGLGPRSRRSPAGRSSASAAGAGGARSCRGLEVACYYVVSTALTKRDQARLRLAFGSVGVKMTTSRSSSERGTDGVGWRDDSGRGWGHGSETRRGIGGSIANASTAGRGERPSQVEPGHRGARAFAAGGSGPRRLSFQ